MAEIEGMRQLQSRLASVSKVTFGVNAMRMLGQAAVREQMLLTQPNKKTGTTQRSIHVSAVTATSVSTQAAAAARWLEFGTKPHIIRPKVAKVLAWGGPRRLTGTLREGASATHFAMVVHHPGSKPYPFMMPGARKAVEKAGLLDRIVVAWNNGA